MGETNIIFDDSKCDTGNDGNAQRIHWLIGPELWTWTVSGV